MSVAAYLVFGIYTATLCYVTVYCLLQFNLLIKYARSDKNSLEKPPSRSIKKQPDKHLVMAGAHRADSNDLMIDGEDQTEVLPYVTVQLPIYNEKYVVERLIDAVAAFDYPKDRFEIHILDDSTDETVAIVGAKVEEYQDKGIRIKQIRRAIRQGFKAGALRDALPVARGQFIAIFDADFLPRPDFLQQTIPYFNDPKVGVVQTRWEHINESYSLLTRLQALQLNVHFSVEQGGRMAGDYFLQFNGTAGVWRRKTIEEAGGWEADTLTEDLDLSIRAQLKGWRIQYLEQVGAPAELPAEMNSLKSQQFRWMKGGAETAKKMLPTVWRSSISLNKKIQTTFHLLASTIFVFVFVMGVFSVPLLFFISQSNLLGIDGHFFAYFMVGLLAIAAVYYVGNVHAAGHKGSKLKAALKLIFLFPLFLALSMGLSLHNTIAIIQGYRGKKSPFVRTPKLNIRNITDRLSRNKYITAKLSWTTILEGILAVYFGAAVIWGIQNAQMTFILYHIMLALGFGGIFYFSIRHLRLKN